MCNTANDSPRPILLVTPMRTVRSPKRLASRTSTMGARIRSSSPVRSGQYDILSACHTIYHIVHPRLKFPSSSTNSTVRNATYCRGIPGGTCNTDSDCLSDERCNAFGHGNRACITKSPEQAQEGDKCTSNAQCASFQSCVNYGAGVQACISKWVVYRCRVLNPRNVVS